MSANPPSADLVRLTVSARNRTTDLVLPSRLPLAEILPEVASMAGSLDAYEAYGGYALVQVDGRALDPDSSFLAQGVRDGAVLSLVTGAEAGEKKVYDDVTEAVADSVENVGAGWTEQAARLTTLGVSALLLVLGVLALFIQRGHGPVVVIVASVATVLLVLAGAVFARVRSDLAAGTVVLLAAALFAVVGVLSSVQGDPFQLPLLVAGIALVVVGAVSMGVAPGRGWAFMPVLVLGFAGAGIGGITVANAFEPARVVAILMVVAVILGSVIPWFALTSSRDDGPTTAVRGRDPRRPAPHRPRARPPGGGAGPRAGARPLAQRRPPRRHQRPGRRAPGLAGPCPVLGLGPGPGHADAAVPARP